MRGKPCYIISLLSGLIPMILGTIIFWFWFYYPKLDKLELWGIRTIYISIPICVIGLFLIIICRSKNRGDFQSKRKTTIVMLILFGNIPLAIFYVWFAFYIMDTERITINNNSESDVKNILIFGTGEKNIIDKIEKGKSITTWVHMTKDGSIKMKYEQNEKIDTTYLTGYTGPLLGGNKSEYNFTEK